MCRPRMRDKLHRVWRHKIRKGSFLWRIRRGIRIRWFIRDDGYHRRE